MTLTGVSTVTHELIVKHIYIHVPIYLYSIGSVHGFANKD